MAFTRAQLIDALMARTGFTKNRASGTVETLLEPMKRSLEGGDVLLSSGFGKLCVKSKHARGGRNPATGQGLLLSPPKVIALKCSGKLRQAMNGKSGAP